jgi:hypothetical protein
MCYGNPKARTVVSGAITIVPRHSMRIFLVQKPIIFTVRTQNRRIRKNQIPRAADERQAENTVYGDWRNHC